MDTGPSIYNELNKAWRSTCKVLFGDELGELKEFEDWVSEYSPEVKKKSSHISGKEVALVVDEYCPTAKFISADELKETSAPLDINDIKDIDSIMSAVSEQMEYCGNRILGNSSTVTSSDIVIDSHYVYDSINIQECSRVMSSFMIRSAKHMFGSAFSGLCEFMVKSLVNINANRCVDSHFISNGSDIYFSYRCVGCSDLLFTFNQNNKRHMIGNLQLPKDRYLQLKKKILGEIADELKRKKTFPSLFSLVPNERTEIDMEIAATTPLEVNIEPIEKAFSATAEIVLKKELRGIQQYEPWLMRHALKPKEVTSRFGSKIYLPVGFGFSEYTALLPDKELVSQNEADALGALHLSEKSVGGLNSIRENIGNIAYFCPDASHGINRNAIESPCIDTASNVYKAYGATYSEHIGAMSLPIESSYLFGGYRNVKSKFCINCYVSLYLNRCFEVDTSTKCSDTYFAHNCEGLQEAMFCFNTKGKRYAIGNAQLPPEQYKKIKSMLLGQISDEIVKTKSLRYDVFNIGCGKQ